VFEGPAMGCALVCNETPDLHLFLEPGTDCMTFTDYGEAIDCIEMLLANEDARLRIAENGYKKIRPHTWNDRVRRMVDVVQHIVSAESHNNMMMDWLMSLKGVK
jgi:spore maturation protein CgeB